MVLIFLRIGKEERLPEPMRIGLNIFYGIVNGIANNTVEMVDEPDKLSVRAARSPIGDHDYARGGWFLWNVHHVTT